MLPRDPSHTCVPPLTPSLQLISHQFCHGNLSHLSSNLFQLCVFGRFVEDSEGAFGVVMIFLLTGIGMNQYGYIWIGIPVDMGDICISV